MAEITNALTGRRIEAIWKNDSSVVIRTIEGKELIIGWADEAGNPVKGEPYIIQFRHHVIAKPARLNGRPIKIGN